MRFPLVLSYCFSGLCLGAYALLHSDFVAGLPLNEINEPNYNLAVPVFVMGMLTRRVNGQDATGGGPLNFKKILRNWAI